MPRFTSSMPPNGPAYCTHGDPTFVPSRTPSQRDGAAGARQRRAPTGGSANGMPSQTALPYRPVKPTTSPEVVVRRSAASGTGGGEADWRPPQARSSTKDSAIRMPIHPACGAASSSDAVRAAHQPSAVDNLARSRSSARIVRPGTSGRRTQIAEKMSSGPRQT